MFLSFKRFVERRWSSWGEWSLCSSGCIQIRRRKCVAHTIENIVFPKIDATLQCSGKDFQTAECKAEHCQIIKKGKS